MRPPALALALTLLALALLPAPAVAQGGARIPVVPMDRFQWLGELAGSCWRGTNAEGKEMETQCYSVQWDRLLRATTRTRVPRGEKVTVLEGETVIAWNPRNGQYDVAQWNAEGRLVASEATLHKGAFRFWTRERDGSDPKERTIWRRYGKERFEVTLERRDGDRWRTVKTTTYDRVAGAP
ncbi:MAG TPA: hypothetical protein PLL32_10745 [Anaeromyxobacteraceae bacterium]|nr:hypothetical protein [Anaeromyxobacteraceae bacterium]